MHTRGFSCSSNEHNLCGVRGRAAFKKGVLWGLIFTWYCWEDEGCEEYVR